MHRRPCEAGVPVVCPAGGHAGYLDAGELLAHLPPRDYPAQALSNEIYLQGGVRSCGFGELVHGDAMPLQLVRLALPRRVYTASHLEYVAEIVIGVMRAARRIRPHTLLEGTGPLAHFTARLEPARA